MKNKYYVLRAFRNGRAAGGYDYGKPNRFATLAEAEENATSFATDVLDSCAYDLIIVGAGAVRNGMAAGRGRRIAEYSVPGRQLHGEIVRRIYEEL